MKTNLRKPGHLERGSTLVYSMVFCGILTIATYSIMEFSRVRVQAAHNRWDWSEAYFHAENGITWAGQRIADQLSPNGQFKASDGTVSLSYLTGLNGASNTSFRELWVTVTADPAGGSGMYLATSTAKVGNKLRTVQATIKKNPPSQVFDYEYFLNNWGWWWGSAITGSGDNRANWDFDFRDGPTVNGSVIASGQIESNQQHIDPLSGNVPLHGLAASDPVKYLHDGSERLPMPNLKDFTYYSDLATTKEGKLSVGSTLVVAGTQNNAAQPGLYLEGTTNNPIKVDGPVVIPGDVVIKGVITGVGTIYVGGNLYLAGDVTYKNGPDFSSPPENMTTTARDAWVRNNLSDKKDLVCFAVRETVLGGDVNSSEWKSACFDPSSYGLKGVGSEASLGADGIAGTPDDNAKYLDTNGDGKADSAWYDADGDGVVDSNYNYEGQITMRAARAAKILNYPKQGDGVTPVDFTSLASNNFNRLDGVFYTNHAMAMRSTKSNLRINGSVISRDEAIIFTTTCKFVYDSRIHSRYSDDPNRFIDLGLPIAFRVAIKHLKEITPIEGFCTTAY